MRSKSIKERSRVVLFYVAHLGVYDEWVAWSVCLICLIGIYTLVTNSFMQGYSMSVEIELEIEIEIEMEIISRKDKMALAP